MPTKSLLPGRLERWLLAFAVVLVLGFGWIGYYGSDDSSYLVGIWGWVENAPFVGKDHWSLRHTVVIPVAALFQWIGVSEWTLTAPTIAYVCGILYLLYSLVEKYFDPVAAICTALLVLTLPLVATLGTTVVPEFAEAFFCLLGLRLFVAALHSPQRQNALLFACGFACGFAWLTRETSVFFFVSFGILFLFAPQMHRRKYFLILLGFLLVAAAEWLYFLIAAGDPFYRLKTDLQTHLKIDLSKGAGEVMDRGTSVTSRVEGDMFGELSRTGNISVNRLMDPILAIAANQEFMFFFYAALPVTIYMTFLGGTRNLTELQKKVLRIVCIFAGIWFVFLFLQFGMTLLPRYFLMPSLLLSLPLGVFLARLFGGRPLFAWIILIGMLGTNFAGIYIDNRNPLFAERSLADYLKSHQQNVLSDPETARRGIFLYDLAGVRQYVRAGVPASGDLFYYNPRYLELGQYVGGPQAAKEKFAAYKPSPNWVLVSEFKEDRKLFGVVIEALGLRRFVPAEIYRRLDQPNLPTFLYRVG